MKFFSKLLLAATLLFAPDALAVTQSGAVTAGNCTKWAANQTIEDAGSVCGSGTVTSVTGTSPIVSSGGTTPAISIGQATTSTAGYLSSTDWNTFNGKQPAGSYLSNITGLVLAGTNISISGSGTSGSPYSISSTGGTNYWTASGNNIYNNNSGFVGDGTSSPSVQLDVVAAGATVPNPTSISVSLLAESLTNGPTASTSGLIYGPLDPTGGAGAQNINETGFFATGTGAVYQYNVFAFDTISSVDYTSPGANSFTVSDTLPFPQNNGSDAGSSENPGYSGYNNNDTVSAVAYPYLVYNGIEYASSNPFGLTTISLSNNPSGIDWRWNPATDQFGGGVSGYIIVITDQTTSTNFSYDVGNTTTYADMNAGGTVTINAGGVPFGIDLTWTGSSNGDGSPVAGYIVQNNSFSKNYNVGNVTSYSDTNIGSFISYSGFTGLTASGQTINYTPYLQGTSPSGTLYYGNAGSGFSITDFVNNGSLFQIPITISGSSGGNWALNEDINSASASGTGDQTFYQTAYFGGAFVSTQHYGFLADGSGNQLTTVFQLNNYDPINIIYSAGAADSGTSDPGDSNYYYFSGVQNLGSGTDAKDTIAFNGGGPSIGIITAATSFVYDVFSSWGDGPIITPTSLSATAVIAQNTAAAVSDVAALKVISTNATPAPAVSWLDGSAIEYLRMGYDPANAVNYINSTSGDLDIRSSGTTNTKLYSSTSRFNVGRLSGYDFTIGSLNFNNLFEVFNDSDSVALGGGANTSSWLNLSAGSSTKAQLNFATQSTPPSGPNNGDMWFDGSHLYFHLGGFASYTAHPLQTGTASLLTPGRLVATDSNSNQIDAGPFTTGAYPIGNASGGLSNSTAITLGAGPVLSFADNALFQQGAGISAGEAFGIGAGGAITGFAKTYNTRAISGTLGPGIDTMNITASGATTQTLPTAVGITGTIKTVKNVAAGTVTVATTSSQTIDGVTTQLLATNQSITVQSTGTNWIIIDSVGFGSVTSVGLSLPSFITVSGSPITTAGTLTGALATQAANAVFAGPASGSAAAPTFRALVTADLPSGTGTVTSIATGTGLSGGTITSTGTISSNAIYQIPFAPGPLTAVTSTISMFGKISKASTVDNIVGSSFLFSCISNPTVTLYECGTSATCTSPTTIGSVTVTATGQAFNGTISSSVITAGDYVAWAITAGTCTSLDISATAQVHSN